MNRPMTSIVPGTSTLVRGGLAYGDVREILQGQEAGGIVAGVDLILLNFIGSNFHNRR